MPENCENWLGVVNGDVYCAHQTREIYQVLPQSVDFKAPGEIWNPLHKTVLSTLHWRHVMSSSQITRLTIVYSTVYPGADQRKHQSSASLAFVRGIHRWPVNYPHKGPVTQKMSPFHDVIMERSLISNNGHGNIWNDHKSNLSAAPVNIFLNFDTDTMYAYFNNCPQGTNQNKMQKKSKDINAFKHRQTEHHFAGDIFKKI